jgi:hypothetical protein
MRFLGYKTQRSDRPDDGQDNLFEPMPGYAQVEGEFKQGAMPFSAYT